MTFDLGEGPLKLLLCTSSHEGEHLWNSVHVDIWPPTMTLTLECSKCMWPLTSSSDLALEAGQLKPLLCIVSHWSELIYMCERTSFKDIAKHKTSRTNTQCIDLWPQAGTLTLTLGSWNLCYSFSLTVLTYAWNIFQNWTRSFQDRKTQKRHGLIFANFDFKQWPWPLSGAAETFAIHVVSFR